MPSGTTRALLAGLGRSLRHLLPKERPASGKDRLAGQRHMEAILDSSPLAIVAVGLDKRATIWNAAAEALFGYRSDEVIGYVPLKPYGQGDLILALVDSALAGDKIADQEIQLLDRNGEPIDVAAHLSPLIGSSGEIEGAIGVFEDIRPRKRAEAERERLEGQLLHSQRIQAIGQLAGGVAHDFNNLLTVIRGHAEMARFDVEPTDELAEHLDGITAAADRSAKLTSQLLSFSRQQTLQPEVINLNTVATELKPMLARLIDQRVAIELDLAPGLGNVFADRSHFEQVVVNLALNARDAIIDSGRDSGRISIETRNAHLEQDFIDRSFLESQPDAAGDYVLLRVRDDGSGMDRETLSHAFEPFFTTKEVGQGTGLGLSMVYGLVKQAQGFVAIDSTVGSGTSISIYLPRVDVPVTVGQEPVTADGGKESVLLVDDEPLVLEMTAQMLRANGYEVYDVPGPYAALDFFAAGKQADLVMTDVKMPQMDGATLAQLLTSEHGVRRVLFFSGYSAGDLDVSEKIFLQKPFRQGELLDKVRTALENS